MMMRQLNRAMSRLAISRNRVAIRKTLVLFPSKRASPDDLLYTQRTRTDARTMLIVLFIELSLCLPEMVVPSIS